MVVFPGVVRGREFNTSAEMTPHVCLVDVICQRSKAPPPVSSLCSASRRYPTALRQRAQLAIGVLLDHAAVRSDYDDCLSYQLRTDLL